MFSIIGAGPIGSYQAYLLAKRGEKVNVYEEDNKIGKPVRCTGILTKELKEFVEPSKKFVVNKIKKAKIYAPNGKTVEFKFKEEDLIVDRTKFDQHLADKAEKEGAKFLLNHKYKGNSGKELHINNKKIKTDYLIGADGPFSRVAKHNSMWCDRKFIFGDQIVCEKEAEDRNTMEIWLGIGTFAWSVPEKKGISRLGVVCYEDPIGHLKRLKKVSCPKAKIIERQAGHIPLYNPRQILQKDFVSLVGDAATQVKATSYGGIILGMKAAELLAKGPKTYQRNARLKVGKDLYLSLLIRKALNNFTEKDYNKLVETFGKPKLQKVLETNSRDYPSKFAMQLMLKEPSLLKYALKALI